MTPRTTILDLEVLADPSQQPMFFGKGLSLQRFDLPKHKVFLELFEKQMSFFWVPGKFDLTNDQADWERLTEAEQFIFIKNLQYQTLMDSVIARAIGLIERHVSLPEMEAAFAYWRFCEVLHSFSYTEILKGILPERIREIFDSTLHDEEIVRRAVSVKSDYDRLFKDDGNSKRDVLMALVSTQILEGVRFYLSFACSFAFAEPPSAKMVANATILKEICRDENLHVEITSRCLNILRTDPKEGFVETWKECEEDIYAAFRKAVEEEKSWASYLMSRGAVWGLSVEGLQGYVEWLADLRLKGIGLKPIYNHSNPIGIWMDKWLGASQVAPQEIAVESYRTGSVSNDLKSKVNFSAGLGSLLKRT